MNRNMVAGILASAALALVCAFVFASLTVYGVIDTGLARILLAIAWVIGVAGTAISDFVWEKGKKYRVVAPLVVAFVLGASFSRLDAFVLVTKSEQAKTELEKQKPIASSPTPVPLPTKSTVQSASKKTSRIAAVIPSPTPASAPLTPDELAEKVASKLASQQPTPTPTPRPPCRGDNLGLCTDEDLLEWGKPLLKEIDRYFGYYQQESKIATDTLSGMKMVQAHEAAEKALAVRFLDCCANETVTYYKEAASRVGGGHQQQEFFDWEDRLVKLKQGSKDWNDVASHAGGMVLNIRYELEMRMIELETEIKMKKVRALQ